MSRNNHENRSHEGGNAATPEPAPIATLSLPDRPAWGALSAQAEARRSTANSSVKQSHESYALTTQSPGASIFECSTLSPRECGILELIGQGYSTKRVARALGITAETVKSHVKRVFIKLDVNTRAHAVARAQSLGLFGLEFVRPRSATSARETDDSVA